MTFLRLDHFCYRLQLKHRCTQKNQLSGLTTQPIQRISTDRFRSNSKLSSQQHQETSERNAANESYPQKEPSNIFAVQRVQAKWRFTINLLIGRTFIQTGNDKNKNGRPARIVERFFPDRDCSHHLSFSKMICELKPNFHLAFQQIPNHVDCKKSVVFVILFLLEFKASVVVNGNGFFSP